MGNSSPLLTKLKFSCTSHCITSEDLKTALHHYLLSITKTSLPLKAKDLLPMSSKLQQLYTATIALNNMAVSLIERGLYLPATEALNNAAVIMKDISQLSLGQLSCPQDEASRRNTSDMLRRAEIHLLRMGQKLYPAKFNIRVVNEDSAASAVKAMQDTSSLTRWDKKSIVLIRMEVCSIQDLRYRDPNFDSGLILYNLGCVQLCQALTCDPSSLQLLKNAQRLFLFSLTILENVIDDKEAKDEEDDDVSYILAAIIIVLQNLTRTASMLGQQEDVERYSSQAVSFEEFLTETIFLSALFPLLSSAAAAA